jgi:hypothetical protein
MILQFGIEGHSCHVARSTSFLSIERQDNKRAKSLNGVKCAFNCYSKDAMFSLLADC